MSDYIEVTPGTGAKVGARQVVEGQDTLYHQTAVPAAGIITLPDTPQISEATTAGTKSGDVDVQGKGRIVCKISYSTDDAEATWRVYFKDSGGNLILATEEISVSNLGIADGSRYLGQGIVLANEVGAASVELELVSAPTNSGNASAWVVGV